MRRATIWLSAFALSTTATMGMSHACAPAPSCWFKTGPAYVKSVCLGFAKDHQTLKQIAEYLEEPEKSQHSARRARNLTSL